MLYCTVTTKENAARLLMSICRRDKVYTANTDKVVNFDGSLNRGIIGETISDRMVGVFASNHDQYMWVIINEAMYQSSEFFKEIFGPITKDSFKPFDEFEITNGDLLIDNDWENENPSNSSYEDVCAMLGLEPIDAEKEIDELVGQMDPLPEVRIGNEVVSMDSDLIKHYLSGVPSIPASPEWRLMKAIHIIKDEWNRRVANSAKWTNFCPEAIHRARKAIDEKGEIW